MRDGACCAGAGGTSVLAILGALLVPKCPLCVAAWLSAVGMSVGLAYEVAPYVRFVGYGGGFLALAAVAFFGFRARHATRAAWRSGGATPNVGRR